MPYARKRYSTRRYVRSAVKTATRYRRKSRKVPAKTRSWAYAAGAKDVGPKTKMPFGHSLNQNIHVDGLLIDKSFLPPTLLTKHRYVERLSLSNENMTGISGNEIAFRLGSLFDPNFSGAGHQPWGYDQMTALYQQYQVYRVKCGVRVFRTVGNDPFLAISVRPNNSNYNLQSKFMYEIMERAGTTVLTFDQNSADMGGNGRAVDKTWQGDYYLADIEGLTRAEYYNDVTYKGTISTNPTKSPFMSVVCGSAVPVPLCTVYLHVEFEYFVKWTVPLTPGES